VITKADGENAPFDTAETEIALFGFAMTKMFGYDTAGVSKCVLCQRKRYAMFFLIFSVFVDIPLKPSFLYEISLA